MTVFKLIMDDIAQLRVGIVSCELPCVEIRGSCQFINYLRAHLNTTTGLPITITRDGCCTSVIAQGFGNIRLIPDETILTGYTAKLL